MPLTPSWTAAAGSLISGLAPTVANGNFGEYTGANVNNLTQPGISLTIHANGSPGITNQEVCGNDGIAGSLLVYTLPSTAYGYNLTNITVYGGWQDAGRDAQDYTVSCSTAASPGSFILLASVSYIPSNSGGIGDATRVVINDAAGGAIARNVAALMFNFSTPDGGGRENGAAGYTAINVQGILATNLIVPPILVTTSNQNSGSSFAPAWAIETDSLIAGQLPSGVGPGDFTLSGGSGVGALTDGTFGNVGTFASYAVCGGVINGAGQSVTYYVSGATLTNIVVYSGWQDNGRDGQFYNISYSTMAAPATFIPLTSVSYNPPVTGFSANRVAISTSSGAPLATNVAFITFDFTPQTSASIFDNGYSGYAEIILEGTNTSAAIAATPAMNTVFPTSSASSADAVLTFNEIMYHPATNEAGMEWMEFYNQLAVDIDISGWRVTGDTDFVFPAGTRVAGRSYIVLARNPTTLMAATGLSSNVFGPFVSPLNNQGGTLELYNNSGRLMDAVAFGTDGDWPVTPDGAGPSLAKIDHDWGSASAANWKAGWQNGGTPGVENFVSPPAPVTAAFNEHSGTTNAVFWVELMNYGTSPVSLGGCILHHDGATNTDYQFPPNVTINPGGFLVLSNSTLGFISPATGDKLFLFATNYSAVYDGLVLKKTPRARSPDGTGTWLVPNLPTPGASNSFAVHTELVVNEIMYDHKDFPAANTNSLPQGNPEEWLELYNRSGSPVDLTGWTLSGGISYSFTAGKTIAPGGYLVVTKDVTTLHATYPAIDIVGNYSGGLGNGDDTIILNDPLGNPANQVHYYSGGRWTEAAGGGGSSLELRDPNADNSKGEAWAPSKESGKSAWQTYTYRMVAQASATPSPDSQWHDFVMGLLTDGECWVDDISVIQSPTNNPVQLISNGSFENGLAGWRVVGNHQRSVVETDPDVPGNHVLHVVASGPQEHMNNHIEQTLGQPVTNGQLYEISFRARWITGNNLLNTRLYFDRVAQTTALPYPQLNGTPGAVNSCYATNIGPTFAQFQHQPVVPLASQATTVFVRAQDPQGVSSCSVFWSVNGGAWFSAPMTLTNGAYSGTIPKQAASSLVQFYVSATDGLGAVSPYPAKGTNSGAFYRVNDGLGDLSKAHNLRMLMSPANVSLQYATTNLMSNENLPCTVIYDERQVYYDMLIRLKSSERGRVDPTRIGFHLEFHPDELFRGVHPVMLVDRSGGGSRPQQEEIVIKHMASHAGVPTVNSDLCRAISPQPAQNGWAILSPRYEDNFVSTTFTNGSSGILYELELTYYPTTANAAGYKLPDPDNVQGTDITDLGTDKERYRYNFIIKNHRNTDDYSTLMNFAQSWSLTGSALDTRSRLTTDVDEWLGAYAMVSLCGVSDMYTFGGEHNLMAYVRPGDNRVLYLPWDMDFCFSQSATAPLVGDQNLGRIVNLPGNLRRFYAHVQDDISTTYNATYMAYWVGHYDSFPGQDWSGDLDYITQRGSYALGTISSAGGNTPFSVNGTNAFTVTNNLVTLSGTAPVQITSLLINGVSYPVTWSSIYAWTVQVPVSASTNALNVQGYDLYGNLVTNATLTVVLTGTVPDPGKCVVINEIMFNPTATNAGYVELCNTSTNFSFDLTGWRVNGLGYDFPAGSIMLPGQYLVLVQDPAAFAAANGTNLPVFDQYGGNLSANGETLTLFRPDPAQPGQEAVVDRVRYEAATPWPVITNGASLQLIDAAQDNSRVADWAAVPANSSATPQWVRASATGIPRPDVTRPLYIYLQSAGGIYVDDVSVVAGSVAESGANVVTNGGFETSLAPWTIGSDGNNSASAVSTAFKHSGASSLHLVASAAGTTLNSSVWQDFSSSLTVGATYTLSFWYLQSTNGGPLTVRFSGSGIVITTNPAPAAVILPVAETPDASNSIAATLPAFPSVWLNELQAVNVTGPTNNFGTNTPWVELYNPGTNALSLAGLYLANNYTNLTQWAFPTNSSIRSNGFLVVWCDGLTNQSATNAPHASFSLAAGAGSVVLSRIINTSVPQIVDYLNYAGLSANWSYGDFPDGQPFYRQTMFVATPGTFNTNTSPPISIVINEWMADNSHTLANPLNGKFDDWFELYNYGTNTVDLGGYYLTGTLTNKTKCLIPNTHQYLVPPKGFFLVWADNNSGSNATNRPDLHVNFKLGKSGDNIGLFAPDGTTIDAFSFGAQATDVSEGRYPDGGPALFFMPAPTPLTNNLIPNTAPSLSAISDKYVHVGQTVQFTATATDAESAYQTLTFSLSNAPAGAGINPASGVFLWATTNAAAPATNSITVRVTDNGTPSLSDAKTYSVFVSGLPQFAGATAGINGQIQLSFNTLLGQAYQVQFKNDLGDAGWTTLGGIIPGTGSTLTASDDMTGSSRRYYRLLALPQ